jgi:hypothetical protein
MGTKLLPVKLTEDELAMRRDELADGVLIRKAKAEEAREVAGDYRDEIKDIDQDIARLARTVRDKTEERMVPVREEANHERGAVETIRLDTGEVCAARLMEPHERQVRLFEAQEG